MSQGSFLMFSKFKVDVTLVCEWINNHRAGSQLKMSTFMNPHSCAQKHVRIKVKGSPDSTLNSKHHSTFYIRNNYGILRIICCKLPMWQPRLLEGKNWMINLYLRLSPAARLHSFRPSFFRYFTETSTAYIKPEQQQLCGMTQFRKLRIYCWRQPKQMSISWCQVHLGA